MAAGALLAGGALAQAPSELKALIDQGRAEAAYQLGRKAPERLGEAEFDLYFGVAAVHSGHAAEGVLALERFLLGFPEHDGARLELARGYFLLGDDARAKDEFEAARARKPTPEALRVIDEHLEALRSRQSRYQPTGIAWLEAGGGYDSNPRAGIDNPTIDLPVLGEVTVLDTGVRVADRSWTYGGGMRLTLPVTPRSILFLAAQAESVRYDELKEFEQGAYAGTLGGQGQRGAFGWRGGVSAAYQTLAHRPYRQTRGAFAEGSWALGERNAVSGSLQGGRFRFDGSNAVRDADFLTASLGWRHRLAHAWRPEFEAGVNAGREKVLLAERQDLARDLYGARLAMALTPWTRWSVGAVLQHQRSDYREADAVLLTTREDRYSAAELNLGWQVLPGLLLRVEASTAKNDSNIALYEYRRKTGLIRVRYEFR